MKNIIMFGSPGAGKGTQAEKINEKYGLIHISTGSILRDEIYRKTELGQKAKTIIDAGGLIPDEIMIDIIYNFINKNEESTGFIFDGFPRTIKQVKELDAFLEKKGEKIDKMFVLDVPETILIERLQKRAKLDNRADDQDLKIIHKRFDLYKTITLPLIDYYKKQEKYQEINGVGEVDAIFSEIEEIINEV